MDARMNAARRVCIVAFGLSAPSACGREPYATQAPEPPPSAAPTSGQPAVPTEPPAIAPAAGCSIEITGAYSASSTTALATADLADLEEGGLGIGCEFRQADGWAIFQLSLGNVAGPGVYSATSPLLDVSESGGGAEFTQGVCNVILETFAASTRGGLRARFSCPAISADPYGTVAVVGTLDLPPPAAVAADAGTAQDAGDAGSTCTMTVSGAYTAVGTGVGDNSGCTIEVGGATYSVFPFESGEEASGPFELADLSGNTWCPSCIIRYYSSAACTTDVQIDEGVGGRFAASFVCDSLHAADGTVLSAYGSIDGVHQPPPQ